MVLTIIWAMNGGAESIPVFQCPTPAQVMAFAAQRGKRIRKWTCDWPDLERGA